MSSCSFSHTCVTVSIRAHNYRFVGVTKWRLPSFVTVQPGPWLCRATHLVTSVFTMTIRTHVCVQVSLNERWKLPSFVTVQLGPWLLISHVCIDYDHQNTCLCAGVAERRLLSFVTVQLGPWQCRATQLVTSVLTVTIRTHVCVQVSLNEGCHQLRLFSQGPNGVDPFTESCLRDANTRIIPCASLLVRLFKVPRGPKGRPLEVRKRDISVASFPSCTLSKWDQSSVKLC